MMRMLLLVLRAVTLLGLTEFIPAATLTPPKVRGAQTVITSIKLRATAYS